MNTMTVRQAKEIVEWMGMVDMPGRVLTKEAKLALQVLSESNSGETKPSVAKQKTEYTHSRSKMALTIYSKNATIYFSSKLVTRIRNMEWKGVEISKISAKGNKQILLGMGEVQIYENNRRANVIYNKELCVFIEKHFQVKPTNDKLVFEAIPYFTEKHQGYLLQPMETGSKNNK